MNRTDIEKLVQKYRPDPQLIQSLNTLTIIMTLGPSGVGKTTLMRASTMPMVVGDASRQPRPGERDGVDYWFRSEAAMIEDAQEGRFVQIALGAEGDLKGTRSSSFPRQGIATFAVVASAIETFRRLPFARTETAVIVPPTYEEWLHRLEKQGTTGEKLRRRLLEAGQSLVFALQDPLARFVLNDTDEAGSRRLRQVADGQEPDAAAEARAIAAQLLRRFANQADTL